MLGKWKAVTVKVVFSDFLKKKKLFCIDFKIYFVYVSVLPACMSIPCIWLVSVEARRVHWIPC